MKLPNQILTLAAVALLSPFAALAAEPATKPAPAIELGAPFADNAILQREVDLPLWGWTKPGIAGVGPGSEFAREVLKADPKATIGLIPCAVGGTSLDQWKVGGPLYNAAVARTKEAMKQGKLAGILWHQGESDSGSPDKVASYAERFSVMIGQLRKDLQAEQVPVVLGELIHGYKTNDSINVELAATAKKVTLCGLVSSEGLGKKALHFDAADARKFGQRYAAEVLKLAKP